MESLTTDFEPDRFRDEYRAKVLDLIDRKAAGQEIAEQPEEEEAAPVTDLMAALEASLADAKQKAGAGRKASSPRGSNGSKDGSRGSHEEQGQDRREVVSPSGTAQEVTVDGRRLRLSNLDKVFYPATGFTKGQVIDYYARVGPTVVPHLKGRALTMKRYPDGADGPFFYEKRCPSHRPEWVHTAPIWSGRNAGEVEYCVIDDLPSLVWAANLANLELHASLGYGDRIDCPTMLMFDLDPGEGVGLLESARVAFLVRDLLGAQGLELVAKTSGGKGIQVAAPLNIETSYDETKPLAQAVAETLERQEPDLVVSRMTRSLREKRVLIDWSQNTASKTTVVVYALRAGERPHVSTPVTFDELEAAVDAGDPEMLRFGPEDVLDRLERLGDLWAPALEKQQVLPDALRRRT